MDTREKLGFVKGLLEGSEIDTAKKEGKVLSAIVDVLTSIVEDIEDAFEEIDIVAEQVDAIDGDLGDVEDFLAGDDDFFDEFEDYDDEDYDSEDATYEVECPYCKTPFTVDYETVLDGGTACPNCGEVLEFEVEEYDENEQFSDED